jgi:hypothetical protein
MVINLLEGIPMMEAAGSSEILKVNQTTQRHILEELNIHRHFGGTSYIHQHGTLLKMKNTRFSVISIHFLPDHTVSHPVSGFYKISCLTAYFLHCH